MAKFTNEVKTGIVVIVAAFLLLILVYKVGGIKIEKGYELHCLFNYVSGLEEKAPVELAGLKVGEVKNVKHIYDGDETKVLVTLSIDEGAKVRQDSKIGIGTTGLIGEKLVTISGGSKGSPFVEKGATLVGKDPFQMEELIETGEKLAARLDSALVDLQTLMKDVDGVVVENKEDIRQAIANLRITAENFKDFSEDIKKHPWKLLMKGKEEKPKEEKKK